VLSLHLFDVLQLHKLHQIGIYKFHTWMSYPTYFLCIWHSNKATKSKILHFMTQKWGFLLVISRGLAPSPQPILGDFSRTRSNHVWLVYMRNNIMTRCVLTHKVVLCVIFIYTQYHRVMAILIPLFVDRWWRLLEDVKKARSDAALFFSWNLI